MNGENGLDAAVAAQRERLAKKSEQNVASALKDEVTAAEAEVKEVAELRVALLSNGQATVAGPDDKDTYLKLLNVAILGAMERAARAGHNLGAELAVRELAAAPNISPLTWFKRKFGRDAARTA